MLTHPLIERVERTGYPYPVGRKSMLDAEMTSKPTRITLPAIPFQTITDKGR
jgi:hypothetical protein